MLSSALAKAIALSATTVSAMLFMKMLFMQDFDLKRRSKASFPIALRRMVSVV